MELGARLKKARESKRFSQYEVSHLLGVSQKTLSNMCIRSVARSQIYC